MLPELRCDNEERVWECAYATAFVALKLKYREQRGGESEAATSLAAYGAQDAADEAVQELRRMRQARQEG